jgi:hypothetical protein
MNYVMLLLVHEAAGRCEMKIIGDRDTGKCFAVEPN